MKRTLSRRVTGTASAVIILVLLLGGAIYLRTASNASQIDNRNLRELARIGQGIEGRVNNLQTVLRSLAGEEEFINIITEIDSLKKNTVPSKRQIDSLKSRKNMLLKDKARLIPHFTVDTVRSLIPTSVNSIPAHRTVFKFNLADESLRFSYKVKKDSIRSTINARYEFSALQTALSSDYMETVFLADEKGTVFMLESDRSGVRIHELAALDTLHFKSDSDISGVGVSDIANISIAGQEYRFYLLPIRVDLIQLQSGDTVPEAEYTKWILGGMVPVSEYRQQSLSLDPNTALFLGFLVVAGFLVVPFVRVFTMGPKERLRVSHLLYLVIALILGTGFAGLFLADVFYYSQLRADINKQLSGTADTVVRNLDREIRIALDQLDSLNVKLRDTTKTEVNLAVNISSDEFNDIRMRDSIRVDPVIYPHFYPYFHMVFWTNSKGMQIAKWTPRSWNTPRVDVSKRDYFRAIVNDRGWKQNFHVDRKKNTCDEAGRRETDTTPYYIESIRSWTTGENLASMSIPWNYRSENSPDSTGITAITTEFASLTKPVLPAGVNLAVVDANARTLFHTRPERILEENFAEETSQRDLLRSVLAARACKELELTYGGRRKMIVVRPLPERPLYLILFKDMALIDTVRFETWFEGGALFTIWVIMILILLFILNRIATTRMGWLWPDIDRPGKFAALLVISLPFIVIFLKHAMEHGHLHIHTASLLVPVKFLGIGLVVLSWGRWPNPRSRESILGWILFLFAVIVLLVLSVKFRPVPVYEMAAGAVSLLFVAVWLWLPEMRNFMNRWSNDLSPRMVYTAAMVSGLFVLGLLPGYLTYKFTFHDHSEHLVKYHQLERVDTLNDRQVRINEIMRDGRGDEYRKEMETRGYDMAFEGLLFGTKKNSHAVSDSADTTHGVHDHSTGLHNNMHGFLGNRIPFLSEASVKMRQLSADPVDWKWGYSANGDTLQLQIDETLITSMLPSAASWRNFWRILLLSIALGGLFLVVYRVSRWVFFIHLEHSDPLTLDDVLPKQGDDWKPMILVGTRSISREPILSRKREVYYIDIISHGRDGTPRLISESIPAESKAVCIDFADHRIEESDWNRCMLEFLEKQIFYGDIRPMILITSRDLTETLLAVKADGRQPDEIKRRWDSVLGRFTKVILSDDVPSGTFETTMQLRLIQKLSRDLNGLTGKIGKALAEDVDNLGKSRDLIDAVEEAAVKMEWLMAELHSLDTLLNPKEPDGIRQRSVYPEEKLRKEADVDCEQLGTVAAHFRDQSETSGGNQQIWKKLKTIAADAENSREKIENIVARATGDAGAAIDEDDFGPGDIERVKQQLQFLFRAIRMWLLPTPRMKAERMVFREKKNAREVFKALLRECGRHERLHDVGGQILARPDWFGLKEDEVVDLVKEGAETYYAARWAILTEEERLVAAQLAKGAVVNPQSRQAVTRLFARGLITRSPEMRLTSESFRRYINDTVSPDLLSKWERAGIPSTWELIRGPLIIALIIVALFLFWAQREFLGSTIAFISTVGVGLGAIINLLGKLERGSAVNNLN